MSVFQRVVPSLALSADTIPSDQKYTTLLNTTGWLAPGCVLGSLCQRSMPSLALSAATKLLSEALVSLIKTVLPATVGGDVSTAPAFARQSRLPFRALNAKTVVLL